MHNPTQLDPDERVFTFQDVAALFRSQKKQLLRVALLSALVIFLGLSLSHEPRYNVEATFRDSGERKEVGLQELLTGIGGGSVESETPTLMKSRRVLGALVQNLGLQVEGPSSGLFCRLRDNWKAEGGLSIEDPDSFVFADVVYDGEKTISLRLSFEDTDHFTVYGSDPIVQGTVGVPTIQGAWQFTLTQAPSHLQLGRLYPLQIHPWLSAVVALRKQVEIASRKGSKSLYDIRISHRDRKLGLKLVNGLMAAYQSYLTRDYEELAEEQLTYLEKRQEDVCANLKQVFDEYATYMQSNIAEGSFLQAGGEVTHLLKPYQEMSLRLLKAQLSCAHLEQMSQNETLSFPQEGILASNFRSLVQEHQHLCQEKDRLGSAVSKYTACQGAMPLNANELEGISLEVANTLFAEYNSKLDQAEAQIRRYTQIRQELKDPHVELTSLSSILTDPFSRELISRASAVAVQLKDEKNRTSKEADRFEEDLLLQRKVLIGHLEQLAKIDEVNALLIREKMASLQWIQLAAVQQRLSLLGDTARDTMKERVKQLAQETEILKKKMAEFRVLGMKLPEKWRQEKWLKFRTEMGVKMMESLTQIAESKTISHHLHRFEAKPLDVAALPLAPAPPFLLLCSFAGAIGVSLAAFGTTLFRTLLKGFPSSFEKLSALRFPLLGKDPSDLETLRQIALFLGRPGQVVALIQGKGPDYSYVLAENLARVSLSSIVIRADFEETDVPGLLQMDHAEPPIQNRSGVDWISSGGLTPYGVDVIQSPIFQQLVETLRTKYDFVFILNRAPLDQTDALVLLRYADKALVTVTGEPTEELTPFIDWAYHDTYVRLQFVTSR